MCGIFGIVLNNQNGAMWKDMDAVENLMYFDALRGKDSTGVGVFDNEAGIRLLKGAIDAQSFLGSLEWTSVRTQFINNGKALIGHNRKKTIGSIKDETAHPFLIDERYLFMHNGTLFSHKHLANTEVDSEALGIHLVKCEGDTKALGHALEKVNGAYACAWIDKEKEKLFLLRNKERPLWMGKWEGGWAFCSEPGFMRLAFIRQGIKFEEAHEVLENTLVSFDLSQANTEPLTEIITIKKHTPTKVYPTVSVHGGTTANAEISKNKFKRLSKKGLVGREINFKLIDFVERAPNDPQCRDWYIMGESNELAFPHLIHGQLNNASKETMWDLYLDLPWKGEVSSMQYDEKLKQVNIYTKQLQMNFVPQMH